MKTTAAVSLLLALAAASAAAQEAIPAEVDLLEAAVSRAVDYLLGSRDPLRLGWARPTEAPAAVLGLASGDPVWRTDRGSVDHVAAVASLTAAFFEGLAKANGSLAAAFDDSTFAQFLTALQVTCHDPSDFRGLDLVAEASRRAAAAKRRSPALAGLALPLCIAGARLPVSLRLLGLRRARAPKGVRGKHLCKGLCLERASLYVVALTCITRQNPELYSSEELAWAADTLRDNLQYLSLHERAQPGYDRRNLFEASLLAQAHQVTHEGGLPGVDLEAVLAELLSFQEADGSFGGSVALTAAAIPALSGYNALDIKKGAIDVECKSVFAAEDENDPDADVAVVHYRIEDRFYNAQTLVGDLEVERGGSVVDALREFEQRHPSVINFELKESTFGTRLSSLLGISEEQNARWNVYLIWSNGSNGPDGERALDLAESSLSNGDTVVIRFER